MRQLRTSYALLGAFVVALCTLVFLAGFYTATRAYRANVSPIVVERLPIHESNSTPQLELTQEAGGANASIQTEGVVASVNSDKYHFLRCPGAKQIKEENKITFRNAAEAISAGFTLAGNCK